MRDRAIALGTIIAVFGIWCEGRSLFFTQASISVESSQCLVFGVRGDRYEFGGAIAFFASIPICYVQEQEL